MNVSDMGHVCLKIMVGKKKYTKQTIVSTIIVVELVVTFRMYKNRNLLIGLDFYIYMRKRAWHFELFFNIKILKGLLT